MPDSDYLFTISEVAAVFVGFAGLVSVIGQRSRGSSLLELALLRNMLLLAILVTLSGLIPHVALRMGQGEAVAWRFSSGSFLLGLVAYSVYVIPQAARSVLTQGRARRILWYFNLGLHGIAGLSLATVVVTPEDAAALYLLALLVELYMVSYLLLRLFLRLATPRSGGSDA